MAVMYGGDCITIPADGDNSAGQFTLTTVDSNGRADIAAANSETIVGIQQNKPGAIDRGTTVQTNGVSKLKIGGTVAVGDRLTADASGFGVATTTAGHKVGAIALTAGVSGDYIDVLVVPGAFGA